MKRIKNEVDSECYLKTDRISDLPDSLIDCILDRLANDLPTVVRTSVLSKRWKFCWTRMRKLVFYMDSISLNGQCDFKGVVNSILSRHDGQVDKFCLYAPYERAPSRKYDISPWITLLSEKKICEIHLYGTPLFYVGSPSCIMNCATLTHLSLHFCQFGRSSNFGGFTNLVYLHLEGVLMITGPFLMNLISNSPHLRDLTILHVAIKDNYRVVIRAPGLRSLSLNLNGKLCLKEYPNLTYASLDSKFKVPTLDQQRTSKLDNFVRLMPKVEHLILTQPALIELATGDIPLKLPTLLVTLMYLEFKDLDILSPNTLLCIFCLIQSSPNLRSLAINVNDTIYRDSEEDAIRLYETKKKEGILSHLSVMTFTRLRGYDCEVKFISTFLTCCPKLRMVVFSSDWDITRDSEERLFEVLRTLPRPESATIKFKSQWVNGGFLFS